MKHYYETQFAPAEFPREMIRSNGGLVTIVTRTGNGELGESQVPAMTVREGQSWRFDNHLPIGEVVELFIKSIESGSQDELDALRGYLCRRTCSGEEKIQAIISAYFFGRKQGRKE